MIDARLDALLARYAGTGRITAHVGEDSAGVFDIPLMVDGLEIACLRLLADNPVMTYRNAAEEPAALAPDGSMVPLP